MPNEEGARYICGEVIPESEFAELPLTPSCRSCGYASRGCSVGQPCPNCWRGKMEIIP